MESILKRQLQLFYASGLLEFIVPYILGPLSRTVDGNPDVFIRTDKHSKLTEALPTGKTSFVYVANVLIGFWRVPYVTSAYILAENRVQYTIKLLATLCTVLFVKHLATTAFRPQN